MGWQTGLTRLLLHPLVKKPQNTHIVLSLVLLRLIKEVEQMGYLFLFLMKPLKRFVLSKRRKISDNMLMILMCLGILSIMSCLGPLEAG